MLLGGILAVRGSRRLRARFSRRLHGELRLKLIGCWPAIRLVVCLMAIHTALLGQGPGVEQRSAELVLRTPLLVARVLRERSTPISRLVQ